MVRRCWVVYSIPCCHTSTMKPCSWWSLHKSVKSGHVYHIVAVNFHLDNFCEDGWKSLGHGPLVFQAGGHRQQTAHEQDWRGDLFHRWLPWWLQSTQSLVEWHHRMWISQGPKFWQSWHTDSRGKHQYRTKTQTSQSCMTEKMLAQKLLNFPKLGVIIMQTKG